MPIKSIEISQNPVTTWEVYHRSLYPGRRGRSSDFFDFDRTENAEWGYGRLRFKFYGNRPELESFFEYGLGRDVKVYNKKGLVDNHGFIISMILNTGINILRKSMKHMYNRVWARYDDSGGVNPTIRSTVYNDTASQTRFGLIEKVLGGGQQSGAPAINQGVQNKLSWYAWPMIDPDFGVGRGKPYIEVIATGYQWFLSRRMYNQTILVGDDDLSVVAAAVVAACGTDSDGFIATSSITANTIDVPQEYDLDTDALTILGGLAEMGDTSGNRWLPRIEADRHFTIGPITNVRFRYSIDVWDTNMVIEDRDGDIVRPDEIRPNEGIRLMGAARPTSKVYDSDLDTPYISFVESVSYRHKSDRAKIRATKESMAQALLRKLGGITG